MKSKETEHQQANNQPVHRPAASSAAPSLTRLRHGQTHTLSLQALVVPTAARQAEYKKYRFSQFNRISVFTSGLVECLKEKKKKNKRRASGKKEKGI